MYSCQLVGEVKLVRIVLPEAFEFFEEAAVYSFINCVSAISSGN